MSWDEKSAPKLDFDEDYYKVLEVDSKIDYKELKKAYYSIVFIYHPDRKPEEQDKELANKQMMVINGAYRVLKVPETRQKYDDARKDGYVGASAGIRGSGKNVNSKVKPRPTKPAVDYSDIYNDIDQTMRSRSRGKTGRYQGTGTRPGWVDENGKVDEDMFNADKQKRADAADIYNKRTKRADAYQGDEFARASPPPIKQEYVGTVGVNGTVNPGVTKTPTAGADPNWTAKGAIAEEEAEKERVRLESGFIFVTEKSKKTLEEEEADRIAELKKMSIWTRLQIRSQQESYNFFYDIYEQLSNTPVKGPTGELTLLLRILIGNLLGVDKDEGY
eukprot:CAMPEP_0119039090 /NCGR_PEP_ID=MMETSP1177-20130426/8399_1 /TAXON_ID=2985 /ORGANISM="Ochromonas sp, Strain CCMP1899" /LENGTH=331 /DNA_ID=CAMNT_0007002527 /DNA_START=347 /DNA_END=1342 /DNA_ORIENTATION=-